MASSSMSQPTSKRATPEGPLMRLRRHDNTSAAYGAIRFAGSKRMPSKWVAVSANSEADDIVDLMATTWELGKPPVVISVTGAAGAEIDLKSKDKAILERGLINAAKKTGAWIITGGTHTGVMKLVGSMVQRAGDEAPTCIGVAPYGCVFNHEEMAKSGRGQIYHYPKEEPKRTDRAPLDYNHTHFVLVDDGTAGKFGGERSMRVSIEDCICKNIENDTLMDEVLPTPMVLLVVSGGTGTLDTIIATLEKSRPVIVFADSGGVATRIHNYVKKGELPPLSTKLKNGEPENKKELEELKAKLPIVKRLGELLKGANQVKQLTFFHSSDSDDSMHGDDLETEILEAILSDCETTEDAIMHAVKWSAPEIIDTQLQISRQIDAEGLVRAFQSALINTESRSARQVVQTLLSYKASARLVRLNRLFDTQREPACPDPYDVIKFWKTKATKKKRRGNQVVPGGNGGLTKSLTQALADEDVDGFQLLAAELEETGYAKNLAWRKMMADHAAKHGLLKLPRRTRLDNFVPPNFTDLMMWAVVVGQPELAKLLWAGTKAPMRTALMAARVSAKIGYRLGVDHLDADNIEANTATYESWASGVLDEVADVREATWLLTLVPRKRAKDNSITLLWNDSVMDQACNDDYPCKNFVARSNCQELLGNYFHGDYAGSRAKISRGDTNSFKLWAQIFLNFLSGYLLAGVCVPAHSVEVDPANDFEEDDDDDDDDDDRWDDSYFPRKVNGDGAASSASRLCKAFLVQRWHFWGIPRVKFYVHMLFYVIYIFLFLIVVCGPGLGVASNVWPWVYRSGYMDPNMPDSMSLEVGFEALLWLYFLGRVVEEVEQVIIAGRFSSYASEFWNQLDLITLLLMSVCFSLRCVLWFDIMPFSHLPGLGQNGNSVYLGVAPSALGIADETRMYLMQGVQTCFSISALLACLRFIETISIFPHFGMLVTMIGEMFRDSAHIYLFLLWIAFSWSLALTGLMPQGQLSLDYFNRPFWYSLRATLGDVVGLDEIYEQLGDSATTNQNLMAFAAIILLWIFVGFSTITIINLLIAQMSQAYERIEQRAAVFRRYQKVELIREYKDRRSPVPPPFIIVRTAVRLLVLAITGRLFRAADEDDEIETGFNDFMWFSRTEELLKKEIEYRDRFLKKLNEIQADRVEAVVRDTEKLTEDVERLNETVLGRFDRLETSMAKLAALATAPKADALGDKAAAPAGRPMHVPPAKLQPINQVSDAAPKGESLPPLSAKGRHDPLQPGPAPPYGSKAASYYGGGGGGGGGSGRPGGGLAAVRESQAYLSSLSSLPLGGHRQPPRLSQPRSEGMAASDMALVDSARRVFAAYDRDGSGDIDARELQPALRDLGLMAVDSAQAQAILSRYDANDNARLDFVEFTQLLHELREFQSASNRAEREAAARPPASVRAAGGGVGSFGYYSPDQIADIQRQAVQAERDRIEDGARLRSLDAGPPP